MRFNTHITLSICAPESFHLKFFSIFFLWDFLIEIQRTSY